MQVKYIINTQNMNMMWLRDCERRARSFGLDWYRYLHVSSHVVMHRRTVHWKINLSPNFIAAILTDIMSPHQPYEESIATFSCLYIGMSTDRFAIGKEKNCSLTGESFGYRPVHLFYFVDREKVWTCFPSESMSLTSENWNLDIATLLSIIIRNKSKYLFNELSNKLR